MYYITFKPYEGEASYFFLHVDAGKEADFLQALENSPKFDLQDYGSIIDSGFGDEAPEQVMTWVKQWCSSTAA